MRTFVLAMILLPFAFSGGPTPVSACPLCKDALAANADEDVEGINFPAAMNESILLMLAVPYSTFVVLGFFIYRGARRNGDYLEARAETSNLAM